MGPITIERGSDDAVERPAEPPREGFVRRQHDPLRIDESEGFRCGVEHGTRRLEAVSKGLIGPLAPRDIVVDDKGRLLPRVFDDVGGDKHPAHRAFTGFQGTFIFGHPPRSRQVRNEAIPILCTDPVVAGLDADRLGQGQLEQGGSPFVDEEDAPGGK